MRARLAVLPGREQGNAFAPVAPVGVEIAVQGEDPRIPVQLAHAHEARVGEAHRGVGVLAQQAQHGVSLVLKVEARLDHTAVDERGEFLAAAAGALRPEGLKRAGIIREGGSRLSASDYSIGKASAIP